MFLKTFLQKVPLEINPLNIQVKVFKNGPSKICGRQPLNFLKGYLSQILLGPFLSTLAHYTVCFYVLKRSYHSQLHLFITNMFPGESAVRKCSLEGYFEIVVNLRKKVLSQSSFHLINPFYANVPFLYPLKTSENLWFSDVFRGYRNGTLV